MTSISLHSRESRSIFLDCYALLKEWLFPSNAELLDEILLLYEKRVYLAARSLPSLLERNVSILSVIRPCVIRKVLGSSSNSFSYATQRVNAVQRLASSVNMTATMLRSRRRPKPGIISLEPRLHTIFEVSERDYSTENGSFDPAGYFQRWLKLSSSKNGSAEERGGLFLFHKMHCSELISKDFYFQLGSILASESFLSFRNVEKITFFLSSAVTKITSDPLDSYDCHIEHDGFGQIRFIRYVFYDFTLYKLYEAKHLQYFIEDRLDSLFLEFNLLMELASYEEDQKAVQGRLRSIIYLFMRLEQLQPLSSCNQANFFLLNFLLAKFGYPPVFVDKHPDLCGVGASVFTLTSLDDLEFVVKQGMKTWLKECSQ